MPAGRRRGAVEFKPLTLEDLDQVMVLGREMFHEGQFADYPFAEGRAKYMATMAASSDAIFWYGAWAGDELAGFLMGEMMDHAVADRRIGREHFFYVGAKHRGLMAGKGLIKRFEGWCKDMGATSVFIDISSGIDQEKTVRLFKLFGYEQRGVLVEKEL